MRRLAVIAGTVGLLSACGGTAANSHLTVSIDHSDSADLGGAYNPTTIHLATGAEVTWIEHDTRLHTITADDGSFGSTFLSVGQTYTLRFNKPGTYHYHCAIHPHMLGQVIVTG